jgi:3-polyprenyl-4-hydroxybenzoate decarboxylase
MTVSENEPSYQRPYTQRCDMVDGGEGRYLDRLNIEPSVVTRWVLANRRQH